MGRRMSRRSSKKKARAKGSPGPSVPLWKRETLVLLTAFAALDRRWRRRWRGRRAGRRRQDNRSVRAGLRRRRRRRRWRGRRRRWRRRRWGREVVGQSKQQAVRVNPADRAEREGSGIAEI